MAKVKYDVSKVEATGDFETPKPGVYTVKLIECSVTKPEGKDQRIEAVYEIQGKEYKGSRIWDYINLESEASEWKVRQFTDALGLKPKGTLDTEKLVGKKLRVRVVHDTYQGEPRAKAGRLLAPKDADPDESDPDDVEAEEEEDGEDEEEEVDLDAMSRKELKAFIKEEELDIKVTQKMDEDDIREAIAETMEAEDEDEDEGEEDDEKGDDDDDGDDYDEWSDAELKKELKSRGLKTAGKKSALVKRLRADDSGDDPF